MNRRQKLTWILAAVTIISSAASHLVVHVLGIQTAPVMREQTGLSNGSECMCVAGSSLMFYGFDWDKIGKDLGCRLERCATPAASPCELEPICALVTNASLTVVGISFFDMNEHFLGEYRAQTVPITTTLGDLYTSRTDWHFSKRVLSQYPLTWVRKLFPTAGRSLLVMVGIRTWFRQRLGRQTDSEDNLASFNPPAVANERIEDWPAARTLRNLSQLRAACQGRLGFNGPKCRALWRMLEHATPRGKVIVAVLPVSQPFAREFMHEATMREFEKALGAIRDAFPTVTWVRVDQLPELQSNRYYWDLVHLNGEGRSIATEALLVSLKNLANQE